LIFEISSILSLIFLFLALLYINRNTLKLLCFKKKIVVENPMSEKKESLPVLQKKERKKKK
jgi:hypothetical protein